MKIVKCAFHKGLENHQKSVKSQGILKRILSGNPVNSSLAAILESQPLARRKQTVAASGYIYCSARRLVLAVTGY